MSASERTPKGAEKQLLGVPLTDEWLARLHTFFAIPVGDRGRDRHHVLLEEYQALTLSDRYHFSKALASFFNALEPVRESHSTMYDVLEVINVVRPPDARGRLRTLVLRELLAGYYVGELSLHSVAVTALSQYPIDEDIEDYLLRSALSSQDFKYVAQCMQILSSESAVKGIGLLHHLISLAICDRVKELQLVLNVATLLTKVGCRSLYEWFASAERPGGADNEETAAFADLLCTRVLHWSNARTSTDPWTVLLSARLHAGNLVFSPTEDLPLLMALTNVLPREIVMDVVQRCFRFDSSETALVDTGSEAVRAIYKHSGYIVVHNSRGNLRLDLEADRATIEQLEELERSEAAGA